MSDARAARSWRLRALGVLLAIPLAGCSARGEAPLAPPSSETTRIDAVHDALGLPPPGTVWAGAAKVDITPSGPAYLAGFSPGRRSTGVHDPLYARCTYLDDGATPLVLVVLDLVGFLHRDVVDARRRITTRYPASVIVASTHVHAAPDTLGLWGPGWLVPVASGIDPAYIERVESGIAECAASAARAARPATAELARAEAPSQLSYNVHEAERPALAAAKDDELTILRWRDANGAGIATIVGWACHPEALGRDNTLVTADYPGVLNRELEARLGGTSMLVNGALGGLVTVRTPEQGPTGFALAEHVGGTVADVVTRALSAAGAATWAPRGERFAAVSRETLVPFDNGWWRFFRWLGLLDVALDDAGRATTEVTAWRAGPTTWLTVPGELFPSLGADYKGKLTTPFRFLIGLGQDELGYILDPREFEDDLYSYEQMMSPGPQTATVLGASVDGVLEALAGETETAPPGEAP